MHLLLVEDDAMISRTVARALRADHYVLDCVADGDSALSALTASSYDLMLLDLGLPKRDGLTVLVQARSHKLKLPVLIITAREALEDRVAGLDAGADDYLTKPFDLDELLARIRALLRRSHGHADPLLRHGKVSLDVARREVCVDDNPVSLGAKEFTLLQALMARPGVVLTREQLQETLYGWDDEVESNTIEVYIHGLRRKLGTDYIQTLRGVGYRLAAP